MINVGRIISFHGLKGELKVRSFSSLKEEVFKINNEIIVNNNTYEIKKVRKHKDYYLITLSGYENINLIETFLKQEIYFDTSKIAADFIVEKLVGFKVYDKDKLLGIVKDIEYANKYNYLRVRDNKDFLIPILKQFILKVDKEKEIIYTEKGSEFIL